MKEFLLVIKLIGLILSSASILGAERMGKWEDYLRQKFQRDTIHNKSILFYESLMDSLKQSWKLFQNKASIYIDTSAAILGCISPFVLVKLLNDPPDILAPWVIKVIGSIIFVDIIILPILVLVHLVLLSRANIVKAAETEWLEIRGQLPPKPRWVVRLEGIRILLWLLLMLPLHFPGYVIGFAIWSTEKVTILVSAGLLYILRTIIELLTLIVSQPFVWLDIQVKKRKIESTFAVIGLLISASAEILGYFVNE